MKVLAWPAFKTRYKNPYNWLLYSPMAALGAEVEEFSPARLLRDRYDIIHLHWPVETIVRHPSWPVAAARVAVFLALLHLARWRGARIVWTLHDERPHVLLHPALAERCEALLVNCVDATIALCEAGQPAAGEQRLAGLGSKPRFVIPHGHYRPAYPNQVSPAEARDRLQIAPQQPTALFLGHISPYKNVPYLVSTFRRLAAERSLIVAGKPDDDTLRAAIASAAAGDRRIQLHLRFIPDDELQVFYAAADLVVLPFQEILNSGSTLLALSFNRPVLAPHLGALPEWQQRFGPAWVRTYSGPLTPELLEQALTSAAQQPRQPAPIDDLDWLPLSQKTLDVYRQLAA